MVMAKVTSIIGAWCKEPEYAEHLGAIRGRKNKRRRERLKRRRRKTEENRKEHGGPLFKMLLIEVKSFNVE